MPTAAPVFILFFICIIVALYVTMKQRTNKMSALPLNKPNSASIIPYTDMYMRECSILPSALPA
eukprot:10754873-Ditylum_brightwellii.AAC.1